MDVQWRKASRSSEQGDLCVEVADVPGLVAAQWRKASRSSEKGDLCVEVANVPGTVAVRDSVDPDGPKILVGRADFHRFADAIKSL
ncbi:DUF397 domain-containing protein [Actinomadura rayongensis]|uniref:DUF397 domain-containing protein n=1 Tax=Actinomadura rayongensis TaxID=1429076 RepID=A0A6I4W383_9ACTN|nr:DUF397 domain-containing protein [Actinomadura rayongensis]